MIVTGIRPGRYLLHGPQGDELLIEARRVVLEAGATLRVEVPVQVGRRRSLVFAPHGGDLRVLHVEVTTAAGALVARTECSRGANGKYVHEQAFAPGRYVVTAHADAGARWHAAFTVDAGWRADLAIDVPLVR